MGKMLLTIAGERMGKMDGEHFGNLMRQ